MARVKNEPREVAGYAATHIGDGLWQLVEAGTGEWAATASDEFIAEVQKILDRRSKEATEQRKIAEAVSLRLHKAEVELERYRSKEALTLYDRLRLLANDVRMLEDREG